MRSFACGGLKRLRGLLPTAAAAERAQDGAIGGRFASSSYDRWRFLRFRGGEKARSGKVAILVFLFFGVCEAFSRLVSRLR